MVARLFIFSVIILICGASVTKAYPVPSRICGPLFEKLAAKEEPPSSGVLENVHRFSTDEGPHRIFAPGRVTDVATDVVTSNQGKTIIVADEFSMDKILQDRLRRWSPTPQVSDLKPLSSREIELLCDRLNIDKLDLFEAAKRWHDAMNAEDYSDLWARLVDCARGKGSPGLEAEFARGHLFQIKGGDDRYENVEKLWLLGIGEGQPYQNLLGVGGCNALDIARVAATSSESLSLIPTLISTACISVNKGVLKQKLKGPDGTVSEKKVAIKTKVPAAVYIPMKTLEETEPTLLKRYSGSGVADVLGRASGYADYLYNHGVREASHMLKEMGKELKTVNQIGQWIQNDFHDWDQKDIKNLANFSHGASLSVIRDGSERSVGSEHKFYNYIDETWSRENVSATHGEIVGVGTMISMQRIAEEAQRAGVPTEEAFRYVKLIKESLHRLGVPTTASELKKIGLTKERMEDALIAVSRTMINGAPYNSVLGDIGREQDWSILERTFGAF